MDHFHTRDIQQSVARLLANPLPVGKMAGFVMVRDPCLDFRFRHLIAGVVQILRDILDLFGKSLRPSIPFRIVFE